VCKVEPLLCDLRPRGSGPAGPPEVRPTSADPYMLLLGINCSGEHEDMSIIVCFTCMNESMIMGESVWV
jgi:hypothetical protein